MKEPTERWLEKEEKKANPSEPSLQLHVSKEVFEKTIEKAKSNEEFSSENTMVAVDKKEPIDILKEIRQVLITYLEKKFKQKYELSSLDDKALFSKAPDYVSQSNAYLSKNNRSSDIFAVFGLMLFNNEKDQELRFKQGMGLLLMLVLKLDERYQGGYGLFSAKGNKVSNGSELYKLSRQKIETLSDNVNFESIDESQKQAWLKAANEMSSLQAIGHIHNKKLILKANDIVDYIAREVKKMSLDAEDELSLEI